MTTSLLRKSQNIRDKIDVYLLVALVFFLPFERIPSFDVLGVTLRASFLVAGAIIVRAAWLLIKNKQSRDLNVGFTHKALILFLIWVAISALVAINIPRAIQVVAFTWFTAGTALSIGVIYRKEYLDRIIRSLLVSATLVALFGVYQYLGDFLGLPISATGLREIYTWQVFGFPRIQSVALEPLYYCSYLLIPTMILYTRVLMQKKISKYAYAALALFTVSIFLTVSRGGIAALVASLVVLVFYLLALRRTTIVRLSKALAMLVLSFLLSVAVITYLAKPPVNDQVTSGKKGGEAYTRQLRNTGTEQGGDERAKIRTGAWSIIREDGTRVFLGIGAGQFGPYWQNNVKDPKGGWIIVNNEPLELWLEYGLIGLTLFVVFVISLIWRTHNFISRSKDETSVIVSTGLLAYAFATAIQYQTFSTLYIMHVWVAIGLLMAIVLGNNSREGSNEKKTKSAKVKS